MSTRIRRASAKRIEVLDRGHLGRYTMDNPALEREIIELFLQQLPVTLAGLKSAKSSGDWKLATHTMKGSAAAIGATCINLIAAELELRKFDVDAKIKSKLINELEAAIAQFKKMAARIYR